LLSVSSIDFLVMKICGLVKNATPLIRSLGWQGIPESDRLKRSDGMLPAVSVLILLTLQAQQILNQCIKLFL
jgi:hypothetical protein